MVSVLDCQSETHDEAPEITDHESAFIDGHFYLFDGRFVSSKLLPRNETSELRRQKENGPVVWLEAELFLHLASTICRISTRVRVSRPSTRRSDA